MVRVINSVTWQVNNIIVLNDDIGCVVSRVSVGDFHHFQQMLQNNRQHTRKRYLIIA